MDPLTGTHDLSRLLRRSSKAISQPRPKPWRVVADTPCNTGRWPFLFRRECSSSDRDSDTAPLQRRTGSRGPARQVRPEGRAQRLDSSHGVHRSPLRRHGGRLRPLPPGPSSRLRSGTTNPELVPFLPFLPASTVSSAEGGSEDPPFDCLQVCCTLQPAVGFTTFQTPRSAFRLPATRRSWTRRSDGVIPSGEDPSKLFPPRQPSTKPSPRVLLSESAAFTSWRAPSSFVVRPLPCCHGALRAQPTSRLCSTEESVAMAQRFRCVPLDAPMGFDIDAFRCCRAFPRRPDQLDVSPCERARVASPDPNVVGKAKCFGFVWLLASEARSHPRRERKESVACGSGASRRKRLGRIRRNPEGFQGCRWLDPEGKIHPVGPVAPEGARSPTNRIGSPKGPRCDSAHTPKGGTDGSSSCFPQPCAVTRAPLRNPLAADFRRPKAWSSARHSRPRPGGRCVEPFPWTPEGITAEGRVVRPPEGDPLTARGSVHSSKLERRSRARQTSSSSNRFRPESRAGSFRAAPKRVPEPLRGVTRLGDEGERVDVSRQRTFPKTRSSR